jgi:hypothetical protein
VLEFLLDAFIGSYVSKHEYALVIMARETIILFSL